MQVSIWLWIGFNLFVVLMLAIDLGVFHRDAHVVSTKEAGTWTVVWIASALLFNVLIYFQWDNFSPQSAYSNSDAALAFLTAYLIEKSLSVDNIFVFVVVFSYFAVPSAYQHRVLFWGVLGALIMRGMLIFAGSALIHQFHWIIYLFGAFLIFTGVKLAFQDDAELDPERNPLVRLSRRYLPMTEQYEGASFFVRHRGKLLVTPLFLVLIVIETTDLVFALDSIPAIFAVTQDAFIVYTSNVFAILGLRSLYFLLASMLGQFRYLKYGLAAVLTFVGVKMVLSDIFHIPIGISLAVVAGLLVISVAASLLISERPVEVRQPIGD